MASCISCALTKKESEEEAVVVALQGHIGRAERMRLDKMKYDLSLLHSQD
jgi:hypothetical protein